MSFKIPCGGFRLDEESFSLDENGVLSVSGGGRWRFPRNPYTNQRRKPIFRRQNI